MDMGVYTIRTPPKPINLLFNSYLFHFFLYIIDDSNLQELYKLTIIYLIKNYRYY